MPRPKAPRRDHGSAILREAPPAAPASHAEFTFSRIRASTDKHPVRVRSKDAPADAHEGRAEMLDLVEVAVTSQGETDR